MMTREQFERLKDEVRNLSALFSEMDNLDGFQNQPSRAAAVEKYVSMQ